MEREGRTLPSLTMTAVEAQAPALTKEYIEMDIKNLIGNASSMAMNSFMGDWIHDWIERVRGKESSGGVSGQTDRKVDKVRPLLGLAALSHEEEYAFTRLWQKLDDDEKTYISAFLLEYYIEPSQTGGLLTQFVGKWQYDNFMLLTVNRNSSSRRTGTAKTTSVKVEESPRTDRRADRSAFEGKQKVVDVHRTSTTGGDKTTTTTERSEEHYTPGGKESLDFLKELAFIYAVGGKRAGEEYLRLHKMPTMDAEDLKKVEEFVKKNAEKFGGVLNRTATIYLPNAAATVGANHRAYLDAHKQKMMQRPWWYRII